VQLTDRVAIPAHVITKRVGEDTVLVDLSTGSYFGLDPVGARVFQLTADGLTLGEICDRLIREYDVAPGELQRDVLELVTELVSQRLVAVKE
jgi:hypothetical protein